MARRDLGAGLSPHAAIARALLYTFDMIELDGQDLRREQIEARKAELAKAPAQPYERLALKETPMGSLAWRALGQAALIYLAIGACAVTAQDTQPGRTAFAEMIAFARLGSVACERVVPDVEGFHALALQRLIKPPLTEKEIGAKEKDVKRLRDRIGLNGWCRRYAGKMEQARILVQVLRRKN
jgi:hypothetical protein